MTTTRKPLRLKDVFGSDKPDRMSRRRRIAADARPLAFSEPIPLVLGPIVHTGNGIAADQAITFDGAVPIENE